VTASPSSMWHANDVLTRPEVAERLGVSTSVTYVALRGSSHRLGDANSSAGLLWIVVDWSWCGVLDASSPGGCAVTRLHELAELSCNRCGEEAAGVELGTVPPGWVEFGATSPLEPSHLCDRCAERYRTTLPATLWGKSRQAAWVIGVDLAELDSLVEGRHGTRPPNHAGWRHWFRWPTGGSR
jgi:hypothetical protein